MLPAGSKRKCRRTEYIFVKLPDGNWRGEHRIVAEEKIGRKLIYDSEPILHIDGKHWNNNPDNLYICKDRSEINTLLKSSSIPYPVHSNLNNYK